MRERFGLKVRVDQARDRADLVQTVQMPEKLGPILEQQRDDIRRVHPERAIRVRVLIDQPIRFSVRVRPIPEVQKRREGVRSA